MTQEEKELLLKDLCARLPYNVKVKVECGDIPYAPTILSKLDIKRKVALFNFEVRIENCKPYLRPMSSMTEEECVELDNIEATIENISKVIPNIPYHIEVVSSKQIDWLNAHHFDHRNLIERGLAIAVTEENNPYEN